MKKAVHQLVDLCLGGNNMSVKEQSRLANLYSKAIGRTWGGRLGDLAANWSRYVGVLGRWCSLKVIVDWLS